MEFLKNLGYVLWVYPAVIMTSWTLVTLVAGWLAPLNRPAPFVLSLHPMVILLTVNGRIADRPSLWMMLIFLALGIVPIVGLAALILSIWTSTSMQCHRLKIYRRGRAPQQDIV